MVKSQQGFTLVELIVATTVFMVGLLALLGVNAVVIQLLGSGRRATMAAFYARERLEQLRATDCAGLSDGSQTRGNIYQLAWDVEPANGGVTRRVRLQVTYPARADRIQTDSVETSLLCVR